MHFCLGAPVTYYFLKTVKGFNACYYLQYINHGLIPRNVTVVVTHATQTDRYSDFYHVYSQ